MKKLNIFIVMLTTLTICTKTNAQNTTLEQVIDSTKAAIIAAPIGTANWTQYSQATIDAVNYFLNQAEIINAGSDKGLKQEALKDLRFYNYYFYVNPGRPKATSFNENFTGIIKKKLWTDVNAVIAGSTINQSIVNGEWKLECNITSQWQAAQIKFANNELPITFDITENPIVRFKAKIMPGAKLGDIAASNITFELYSYQAVGVTNPTKSIPADGNWHDVIFNTNLANIFDSFYLYIGNGPQTGLSFEGTVLIDDFKIGAAAAAPDMPVTQHPIFEVIDSCKNVVNTTSIGSDYAQTAQSQLKIANKLISTATIIANGTDVSKKNYALRDLRAQMALYFVPNAQLSIKVKSYFEDFNGIVDTAFVTTNAGGPTSATGISAKVENDALKFNCLGYSNAWFSQSFPFSLKELILDLNDQRYFSFKAKSDVGATWNGLEQDSTRIGLNTGNGDYLNHKIPTDGKWHELSFKLPMDIDYSGIWRVLITPGLSFDDGAVGNEFVGTVWIDDFKAGKAALPFVYSVIDSCKAVVAAVTIGTGPDEYPQSQVNIANKLITGAEVLVATTDQTKMDYALRDLNNGMALYFRPNSQLPVVVNSFFEDFNGIVDTTFFATNAGGITSTTGIDATVENDALVFNCLGYNNAWFSQSFPISSKELLFDLTENRFVSFKARAEVGATWNGMEQDSTRIGFNTGNGDYLNQKIPTDGEWHELSFALPKDIDYSAVWRVLITPGLSFADGAVGNEFVGTIWIDDFKAGKAALPVVYSVIDSCKMVVAAVTIGTGPDEYPQSQVNIANKLIKGAEELVETGDKVKMDYALRDLRNGMALYFRPNSQLPIVVTSFFEDFNGIVDTTFVTTNAGGATSVTGIDAIVEEDALKFNCLGYNNAWFSQSFPISSKQLLFNLTDHRYVSFKAKADVGATWDGVEQDSARIGFNTGNEDYLNQKIPTDGNWHDLAFALPTGIDYSATWRVIFTPGLSFADGAVGHEFVGTIWIDDFKVGGAFVMPNNAELIALIDSSMTVVNAAEIGSGAEQYTQLVVDAANTAIAKANAAKTALTQETVDQATSELRAAMKLFSTNATAVQIVKNRELYIYPNPVSDVLMISIASLNSTLSIYNSLGQQVLKEKIGQVDNVKINVQGLSSGTYIVRLTSENGNYIAKMNKN